ncbi:MAG: hypothetical protein Pars2KO_07280 [Parasphingorhabdus sp.]
MGELSKRSILIVLAITAFVHFGTPLLADLFFELYHLTGIESFYSIYSPLRYITAQYMFWDNRWLVTLLMAMLLFGLAWIWKKWRLSRVQPE